LCRFLFSAVSSELEQVLEPPASEVQALEQVPEREQA